MASAAKLHSQWRLLRTPVRVGRRTLQRRVFWHKIKNIILPHARRDARFRAVTCRQIFTFTSCTRCIGAVVAVSARWRRRRLLRAVVRPCLFHDDLAVEPLQDYLICITVEDKNALLFRVVALIALEDGVWNARSLCVKSTFVKHMECELIAGEVSYPSEEE